MVILYILAKRARFEAWCLVARSTSLTFSRNLSLFATSVNHIGLISWGAKGGVRRKREKMKKDEEDGMVNVRSGSEEKDHSAKFESPLVRCLAQLWWIMEGVLRVFTHTSACGKRTLVP